MGSNVYNNYSLTAKAVREINKQIEFYRLDKLPSKGGRRGPREQVSLHR